MGDGVTFRDVVTNTGGDAVFAEDRQLAVRYSTAHIDVYSTRGLAPHPFIQLFGFTRGFCLVHAAAVSYRGRGILFSGFSAVGKTSMVVSLARHDNVRFLGDDYVFLCGP